MKKYKILILSIFICVIAFTNLDNVYAVSTYLCTGTKEDTCEKKTYKYSENGDTKDFSITLGVYHFKNSNPNAQNEQYIVSFDNCTASKNQKYCSEKPYRFDVRFDNKVSIPVNSSNNSFPLAICAIPYNNHSPLNSMLTDINVNDYVYFSPEEVTNAINTGKCNSDNVFYSDVKLCNNPNNIYTFNSPIDLNYASINANYYWAGTDKICNIEISKDGQKFVYNDTNSSSSCTSKNYNVSCSIDSSNQYSCTLSSCGNDGVGKQCNLINEENSSEIITLSYTYAQDSNVNTHFNSLKINGQNVTDPIIINNGESYALSQTCPNHIYYVKDADGVYRYRIFGTSEIRDLYLKENKKAQIIKKYNFENSTHSDVLTEDELEGEDFKGKVEIDWGDPVDVNCQGIIGDELLDFIKKIFRWIQIIAPIFVIIMSSVEFAGAVLQDDKDALKKATNRFTKRLIIALALFFVPLIITFLLDIFNEITGNFTSTCIK